MNKEPHLFVRKGKPSWTMPYRSAIRPCRNILHVSSGYPIEENKRLDENLDATQRAAFTETSGKG
jgi:hypothetical protein